MSCSDQTDGTIFSVKSGHLTSVFCGQLTSVLTVSSFIVPGSARPGLVTREVATAFFLFPHLLFIPHSRRAFALPHSANKSKGVSG